MAHSARPRSDLEARARAVAAAEAAGRGSNGPQPERLPGGWPAARPVCGCGSDDPGSLSAARRGAGATRAAAAAAAIEKLRGPGPPARQSLRKGLVSEIGFGRGPARPGHHHRPRSTTRQARASAAQACSELSGTCRGGRGARAAESDRRRTAAAETSALRCGRPGVRSDGVGAEGVGWGEWVGVGRGHRSGSEASGWGSGSGGSAWGAAGTTGDGGGDPMPRAWRARTMGQPAAWRPAREGGGGGVD